LNFGFRFRIAEFGLQIGDCACLLDGSQAGIVDCGKDKGKGRLGDKEQEEISDYGSDFQFPISNFQT
jgi:hypothetical protein